MPIWSTIGKEHQFSMIMSSRSLNVWVLAVIHSFAVGLLIVMWIVFEIVIYKLQIIHQIKENGIICLKIRSFTYNLVHHIVYIVYILRFFFIVTARDSLSLVRTCKSLLLFNHLTFLYIGTFVSFMFTIKLYIYSKNFIKLYFIILLKIIVSF